MRNLNILRNIKIKAFIFNFFLKRIDNILDNYDINYLKKIKKGILGLKADVILIAEENNWIIKWIAEYLSIYLKKYNIIQAEITSPFLARNKIIHFSSINSLLNSIRRVKFTKSNKYIITWYHFREIDKKLIDLLQINKRIDHIITPSEITKNKLIESGFMENKISIVPLGIDLNNFRKFDEIHRFQLKKEFNLPIDKTIIGSFQKDGIGWGQGLEPKLIKGPDIFCEVVKKLKKKFNIHVFLTGPSRGYVKKKLEEYEIPYTYIFLDDYAKIVECYNVLDLYLVSSRVEGGPMALLEGMATGVPIITTNVGMAPDIIDNGINGFITLKMALILFKTSVGKM
jgi:glycosyltransferase involved in cell wall biosynthesis